MKKLTTIFVMICGTYFFSCRPMCTQMYCEEGNIITRIMFQNFNASEIDTMLIIKYTKNSNFTTKIDSVFFYANQNNSSLSDEIKMIWFLNQPIDGLQYDFEVKLIYNNSFYKVSDFVLEKQECNKGCDYYNALASYKVNGTQKKEGTITIVK